MLARSNAAMTQHVKTLASCLVHILAPKSVADWERIIGLSWLPRRPIAQALWWFSGASQSSFLMLLATIEHSQASGAVIQL